MTYWMGGKDANSQLHLAANMYAQGADYFPGPIANDYNSSYYQSHFSSAIWDVSKAQIDYHIAHYNDFGYAMYPTISQWPGNGNPSEGVASQLAPYVDVNNNQIYDPVNGDYPDILGDYAVYTIMNDDAGIHTETGGNKLGVEIHSMFYQFNSTNNDLNNTTFMNVKIYNRSSEMYNDFIFGLWMDPDIGYAFDDYVGCDSTRNLGYAYNGEYTDNGANGQDAYGTSPPAVGAVFLNSPMYKYVFYDNSGGQAQGDPSTATQFYQYLNGYWKNGQPFVAGGTGLTGSTTVTSYCLSGDPVTGTGWSEVSEGNPPNDRRFLMSTYLGDLDPYSNKCLDMAIVINNDSIYANYVNVHNLFQTTDYIQDYYNNNISSCNQIVAEVPETTNDVNISVYPNPVSESVYVNVGKPFQYQLVDMKGAVVMNGNSAETSKYLQLNVESGMYILKVKTEDGFAVKKIQIE